MNTNSPIKKKASIGQNQVDGTMYAMLLMAAYLRHEPVARELR